MIIHNVEQGSIDWFQARLGVITASEVKALITPKWAMRTGDGVETYLATKLAERWLKRPLTAFSSPIMEQGSIREKEAVPVFEEQMDLDCEPVGFITTQDGWCGCSPDAMLSPHHHSTQGVEVKCPSPETHVRYLLAGRVPDEYLPQVHFSMYVTGADMWYFMSYCRGLPPLILPVFRNPEIMVAMANATVPFIERVGEAYKRLVALNGNIDPNEVKQ